MSQNQFHDPVGTNAPAADPTHARVLAEEARGFFKNTLLEKIRAVYFHPFERLRGIFEHPESVKFSHVGFFYALVFLATILVPGVLTGGLFKGGDNLKTYLFMGLLFVVAMLLVSCFSFGIKAIFGRPTLRNELLTGALAGLAVFVLLISGTLYGWVKGYSQPMSLLFFLFDGIIGVTIMVLSVLIASNVVTRSLIASGVRRTLSWYMGPLGIMLSLYLSFKIVEFIS